MILKIVILLFLAMGISWHFLGLRKTFRITAYTFLSLIGLIIITWVLVNIPAVQNYLIRRVTENLSDKLHTRVIIRHVRFQLFDRMNIDSMLVDDKQGDTLFYAGKMTVHITDFFFLKEKPVLHFVGMENAVLNLSRTTQDSTWNYQFILDAMASSSSSPDSTGKSIDLDVRQIDLRHVVINKVDGWDGQDMQLSIGSLNLDARSLDLQKHRIQINKLILDNPSFTINNYQSSQAVPGLIPLLTKPSAAGWNAANWKVSINRLTIHQGSFAVTSGKKQPQRGVFDPDHLRVTGIGANFNDTRMIRDSIFSDISLQAKERCGFEIRSLKAGFKISPKEMTFNNLDLLTNHSHIRNYYAMHYGDFANFNDFTDSVDMQARFLNSVISSGDIAYFAPSLAGWKMMFRVFANARGPVSDLNLMDMQISASNMTSLNGNIRITGLPDVAHTYIDFDQGQIHTTGNDLERFFPDLKKATIINLKALSDIRFAGNFTGFPGNFVAYGTFNTNLGVIQSNINLKLNKKSGAVYSGKLSATDLDLGTLLGIPYLGKATLDARIDGQGLNVNNLKANLNSNIDHIMVNGYTYHHIQTNGQFGKKQFNGFLEVQDSCLGLVFQGKIDFKDSLPVFNFDASVTHSDLHALNLTSDSMLFSGQLDLDFAGSNVDNFLGSARLYNINLYKNRHRVAFDSLYVNTSISGNQKNLTLRGNEIDGYVRGIYDLRDLPDAFMVFLNNYYPSLIQKPVNYIPDENFSFALNLGKVDSLIRTFTKNIFGFNDSRISGSLDAAGSSLKITASIPYGGFGKYSFRNIILQGNGNLERLGIQASIAGIYSEDSLLFPNASITTSSTRDSSFIDLKTSASSTLNAADISARIITQSNGYDFSILNSQLTINDKVWKIARDNDLFFTPKAIIVHDFNISHNNQKISLSSNDLSAIDQDSTKPSLIISLQSLNIYDFAVLAKTRSRLEGTLSGNIQVDDPLGNMRIAAQLRAADFRLENDSIGTLNATGAFGKGVLTLHIATLDTKKSFAADGTVGLTDANDGINLIFSLNSQNIGLLNNYLNAYVSRLSGYATGKLVFSGTRSAPQLSGSLELDSTAMIVNYLNTYYTLGRSEIRFSPNFIALGSITLHDPQGNTAILTGNITHDHFRNLNFNCSVTSSKFQFLNTNEVDNNLFYGSVFASGNIGFTGPLKDLQMSVNVSPLQGTHLYLPLSTGADVNKHDFIVFKSYGKTVRPRRFNPNGVNLTIRLNAAMNNQAKINVILDQATGDEIQASGSGTIKMEFSLNGSMSLFGTYTIDQGSYTFIYQRLLTKKFQISRGSTITWNGSPYNADVNVSAIYNVPGGASLYDLISGDVQANSGFLTDADKAMAERKEKVNVYLILTGKLMKPAINFDIRLPEQGITVGSYALSRLDQVKQDNSELTQEVAWLLLFNQFYPVTPSASNSNLIRSGGLTSVGQFLSSTASTQLNNLLGKVIKNRTVGLNVDYNAYSASGEAGDPLQRNEVTVGITKSLFNNRVRLEAGPSVDWGMANYAGNQYTNSSAFAGDFQFEYLITPDGRIRTTVFRRSDYDVLLNGTLSVFGATLTYKRDFNRFRDLFDGNRLKKRQDSLQRTKAAAYNKKLRPPASLPDSSVKK